jgi:hypothetical protein
MLAVTAFLLLAAAYFSAIVYIPYDESRYYTGRHVRTRRPYRPKHANGTRWRLAWNSGQHAIAGAA